MFNKQFAPYVKKEALLYIWGFVGSLFRFLIPLSVPLILKFIFDDVLQGSIYTNAEKVEKLFFIAICMVIIFLFIRYPMEYVRQYCIHTANNNILKKLRQDIFDKIHSLDAKYFTENKSGEIGTRFFDDVEKVKGYLTATFGNILIEMIVLVTVIGIMLVLNPKLAMISIVLITIQFLLAHFFSKKFKVSTKNMMNERSVLNGFVFEKIQGAFISKLFSAEKRDKEELDDRLGQYEVLTNKHAKINALSLSTVNVLIDFTPLLVAFIASWFVIEGNLTVGSLIAFFAYVEKMRSPVAALVQAFPVITEGSVALQRIFDFLNISKTVKEKENPTELKTFNKSITFNNVSFSYDQSRQILNHVNFKMEKGKTYAFVGESGGGKSTILQLLMRMYDTSSGEVLVDGRDIKDYSISSLREQMGIVTQDNFLYSSSIKDNIKLGKPDATDQEVKRAAEKAFADEFIRKLPKGYETEIGERGIKLSGGQKQRISLARVFLKDPSILILDEATSALDNESEKLVQQSLFTVGKDKTVIMIAHRLSTIVNADTIFVLKNGEIIESGSHQQLMRLNGYYKELHSKQNEHETKKPSTKITKMISAV
ncbi:ABC-type multidrug transport system fused ATPase/permease subunit [Ureibacillus xyleni]|uniref:ABC-type multidrug transport system fused ATPase/permease subunit n=1 Tax=Ureibacillus xyleni TaxID=614648 RepID=A0A285T5F4_9BACL|nr:ABC transporter ATP-binding protein [Ureibacillus xyleni]SOC16597.1 ABC-type multidrug transport system fused ATPase/permease subunit [Ureibacillus xyleni]